MSLMISLFNTLLVLLILAALLATWMPSIYQSDWFKLKFAGL